MYCIKRCRRLIEGHFLNNERGGGEGWGNLSKDGVVKEELSRKNKKGKFES